MLIFVYGTLKEGHRNAHVNGGVRVPGDFVTVERLPLYVIGRYRLPWLVDSPGTGEHVVGQLFEVDRVGLERMDRLERITEPDWYVRGEIDVRARHETAAASAGLRSQVYFGSAAKLVSEVIQLGPLAEYTLAHAAPDRL